MKKALLITVGGIGENEKATKSMAHGIVASIKNSHPDLIVFFVTEESRETTLPEIIKTLPDIPPNESILIQDMNDVNEVFDRISGKLRGLREEGYELVVDFTSGTKAMSGGAVVAATLDATMMSYVVGKRIEGKVSKGSERVLTYSPITPVISMQNTVVEELFNSYQFKAATRILDTLLEITAEPDIVERLEKIRRMVEGYSLWDRFDHGKSRELLLEIDEVPFRNKEFLGRLSGSNERKSFYIADLLSNAKRRFEEGKYDDAVARLYRTMELIAQYRLQKKFGIDSSNVDVDKLRPDIQNEYEEMRDGHGKIRLGLVKDYELLGRMDDILGKRFLENRRLQDLLKRRNESILAHGLNPVSREIYQELYGPVLDFAKTTVEYFD